MTIWRIYMDANYLKSELSDQELMLVNSEVRKEF